MLHAYFSTYSQCCAHYNLLQAECVIAAARQASCMCDCHLCEPAWHLRFQMFIAAIKAQSPGATGTTCVVVAGGVVLNQASTYTQQAQCAAINTRLRFATHVLPSAHVYACAAFAIMRPASAHGCRDGGGGGGGAKGGWLAGLQCSVHQFCC